MLRNQQKKHRMLRSDDPQKMSYDPASNVLHVFYRDEVVELKGHMRDEEAPTFTKKSLFMVRKKMTFNISGVDLVSFVNATKTACRGSVGAGRIPKHLRDCRAPISMIELRPWLKGACKTCISTDRQGSFGAYMRQSSMVAAPLT